MTSSPASAAAAQPPAPDAVHPLDRDGLRGRVNQALTAFMDRQADVLSDVGTGMAPVTEALRDFLLDGGKRLRPGFCYWGWRGAGGVDDGPAGDAAVRAATSLELLQASALIHDDLMDRSDTRRGKPAVHRRFEALHGASAWHGDGEGFGSAAALLLGDLCLTWSDEMFSGSGVDPVLLAAAKPLFDVMRTEVMAGQYLDVLEQAMGGGSVERSRRVIRYKSAKYTIERPLHVGAALAGGGPELLAAYSAYGLPLGEAFQLRDDVLGVFGDPAETGKPAGDDLREGKRTVLLALAAERSGPTQTRLLDELVGDPALDDAGVKELRAVIEDTGALAEVESMIDALTESAIQALAAAPITDEAKAVLYGLVEAATVRRV
ncbi:polyprenyl synthetase family protein [Yinghuangia seranimata]|uniref:polyprenyl synthetase family protein n=1 Tax=Yinghuangia seranimata TaxID=408067 RepID=UPI00248CFD41|nr:polyprenyl synthetase family protein [Yinghuangia seranimata]MDI2126154.1 polyprenyl synthetase family protein [Yinghuangia seranimata]